MLFHIMIIDRSTIQPPYYAEYESYCGDIGVVDLKELIASASYKHDLQ